MQPLYIISTVGQSVFNNAEPHIKDRFRDFSKLQEVNPRDILNEKKLDFPGRDLYELRLETLKAQMSDESSLRRASAEINSLIAITQQEKVQAGHYFHFLATATPDGALAARVLRDFCEHYFNPAGVKAEAVYGLQVHDGHLFATAGLPDLVEKTYRVINSPDARDYRLLFNPTGGFKATIPYFTLIGMLSGIDMAYLYEFSNELVMLSALPISFNMGSISQHFSLLEAANQDGGVPASQVLRTLGVEGGRLEQHPLWSLFTPSDDHYFLSGIGGIVYRTLDQQRSYQAVYLTQAVWQAYQQMDTRQQQEWGRFFDVMRDSEWRRNQQHATIEGVKVAKPAGNERLFYFVDESDGAVLIVELAQHSDQSYEKLSADFKQKKRKRADYTRWHYWGS
ncbi:putative CRISPR-associated protein [bacterium]|nr:putative CRISPR-associated protein [bacterium]